MRNRLHPARFSRKPLLMSPPVPAIIVVTLNPAIDRIIEVPSISPGSHQVGRELLMAPAGKGVNVARVLAAMGVPSVATGFLGGENRSLFEPVFAGGTIADEFVTLKGRTRENFTLTDRGRVEDAHIRLPGLAAGREDLARLGETLRRLARPQSIVLFSGSLPPGVAPADFVALVDLCLSAGARLAVDTSGSALSAVADRPLWLVKPNAEELPQLAGRELSGPRERLQAARELSRRIPHVLFSGGGEGAWLFAGECSLHAAASVDPRQVRSTVGCGDALLGAYVGGLVKDLGAREAFIRAVAVASASALSPGPADFDPAVAETLLRGMKVTDCD
jgi:1-phosphofructokinase